MVSKYDHFKLITMKKIMLIEDDNDIAEVVEIILSSKYNVYVHRNGFGIVEALQQHLPDVILIDNSVGQKIAADQNEFSFSCAGSANLRPPRRIRRQRRAFGR